MQTPPKPASRVKMALLWILILGNIAFWIGFWLWRSRSATATEGEENAPDLVRLIFYLFIGGFFLVLGAGAYAGVILTNCLTFNFRAPVLPGIKARVFLANIIVPVLMGLGLGFMLSAFVSPVLGALGINPGLANMLPLLATIALLQILQLFVQIWAPLERRFIAKRLAAQGI